MSSILENGLLPMSRQNIHLSKDIATTNTVGSRHDKKPIILRIYAKEAYISGVKFYNVNDQVWLSQSISPQYIEIVKDLFKK